MENTEQNLLEEPAAKLVPASILKRLANYLVDIVIFSFFVSFLLILAGPVYPLADKLMAKQPISFIDQLMISFIYGLYMSVSEALLKGKSIGKFLTGTRAVDETGQPVNSQTAFIRGLLRIIPFEQISAINIVLNPLGLLPPYPWHDRWSKSFVVDEGKSMIPPKK